MAKARELPQEQKASLAAEMGFIGAKMRAGANPI
jgi:hypothetical protein